MNTDMQEQLSQLIERWISQQPSRSIAALSRLSGVGESSIRRLKNDGVLPTETNTMKILLAISEQKSILKALNHFEQTTPVISDYLKSNFPMITESFFNESTAIVDTGEFMNDYNSYLVFKLASGHGGVSRKSLLDLIGLRANSAIEQLINLDLVSENDGILTAAVKSFTTSLEVAKQHAIKNIDNFYKPTSIHNSFCNISENVSVEGFGDIIELVHETRAKVLHIMKSKPGKIPVMTVMATDTMTVVDIFGKGQ